MPVVRGEETDGSKGKETLSRTDKGNQGKDVLLMKCVVSSETLCRERSQGGMHMQSGDGEKEGSGMKILSFLITIESDMRGKQ